MSYSVSREGDGLIVISPKNEAKQTATVVICHGLGDSAEGFEDVAQVCMLRLSLIQCTSMPSNCPLTPPISNLLYC
jgi:predicted esterase